MCKFQSHMQYQIISYSAILKNKPWHKTPKWMHSYVTNLFLSIFILSGQRTTSPFQPDVFGISWSNRKFFRRLWSVTSLLRKGSRVRSAAHIHPNISACFFISSVFISYDDVHSPSHNYCSGPNIRLYSLENYFFKGGPSDM